MKRRALLVAVMMVCAVISVHAVSFNPFGYSKSVRDSNAIIDVGVGYGWGFDAHLAYDKVVPIPVSDIILPLTFGGNADVAFGNGGIGLAVDFRALWHFDLDIPELDLYVGPSLGFWMYGVGSSNVGAFDGGGVTGARWAFTNNMAGFLELGYTGLTYAKLGITFIL